MLSYKTFLQVKSHRLMKGRLLILCELSVLFSLVTTLRAIQSSLDGLHGAHFVLNRWEKVYKLYNTIVLPGQHSFVYIRKTIEGWPLLTVLKLRWMGTQGVQMKVVLVGCFRWACRAGTRKFCPALAALVGPIQNIFFLTVHSSIHCPYRQASWAGSRAGSPIS